MITAIIGSAAFFAVALLYMLLALGFPFGNLAMGGKHKVMPKKMRAACAFSALVQLAAIVFLLKTGDIISADIPKNMAKGACYFFACYLLINTILNGMSKSKKEKLVMTPLSFLTAMCFFITALNS
ncbi:hypothetical protein [Bacillus sp. MUM 13]|uniref:hypothetical protein n=1 Tax=Bacillus sp. MUM 13 TaxID=1678001 RepID=UPI0009F30FBD|nr:hypothetical protein [Bacillus sp. MUM 13]